jgi:hypothetical protein
VVFWWRAGGRFEANLALHFRDGRLKDSKRVSSLHLRWCFRFISAYRFWYAQRLQGAGAQAGRLRGARQVPLRLPGTAGQRRFESCRGHHLDNLHPPSGEPAPQTLTVTNRLETKMPFHNETCWSTPPGTPERWREVEQYTAQRLQAAADKLLLSMLDCTDEARRFSEGIELVERAFQPSQQERH